MSSVHASDGCVWSFPSVSPVLSGVFWSSVFRCMFSHFPGLWDVCLRLALFWELCSSSAVYQHTLAELKVSLCDSGTQPNGFDTPDLWGKLRRIAKCLSAPDPANGRQETDKTDLYEFVLWERSCNHCTFTS